MRIGISTLPALLLAGLLTLAHPALAQPNTGYKGIWVSTPYPSFNVAPGETVTLDLDVHNAGLPPQRVGLQLERVPDSWSAVFLGDGKRVQSVFVAPGSKASVKLRLEPSTKAADGTHRFEVVAAGADARFRLPIELGMGQSLPPKLTLKPELPELRGSPNADFEFKVAVRNDGGDDATVRIDTVAPPGFRVRLTEQFGAQELTTLPLKVGQEKTVTLKVTPGGKVEEGQYPVDVRATTGKAQAQAQLKMEVTGEPRLDLSGAGERLSGSAIAGEETPIDVIVANNGTAAVQGIKLAANAPSGWKVTFQPEKIDALGPNARETVKALVVPSTKAIAGDYMINVRANAEGGVSKASDFRITVRTSTLWGIVGVLVIAAALLVLVVAMLRYGRR